MPRNKGPDAGATKVLSMPISGGAPFVPTLAISDQQARPGAANGASVDARAIAKQAVVHGLPAGVVVRSRALWKWTVPAARTVIVSPLFTVWPVSVNVCVDGTVTGIGFAAVRFGRGSRWWRNDETCGRHPGQEPGGTADVHLTPHDVDCVATVAIPTVQHRNPPEPSRPRWERPSAGCRRSLRWTRMWWCPPAQRRRGRNLGVVPRPRLRALSCRRGSQIVPLLALVLGAALTAASYKTSWVHLAYRLPRMHAVIDTTIGLVSLLLAYLVYGRVQVLGRQRDYVLAFALGFGGVVNLFAAVTQGVSSMPLGRFEVWTDDARPVARRAAVRGGRDHTGSRRKASGCGPRHSSARSPSRSVADARIVAVASIASALVGPISRSRRPTASNPLFVGPGAAAGRRGRRSRCVQHRRVAASAGVGRARRPHDVARVELSAVRAGEPRLPRVSVDLLRLDLRRRRPPSGRGVAAPRRRGARDQPLLDANSAGDGGAPPGRP